MNILVVAAHPDDEALGCGGTIARHAMAGDTVDVIFLADGVTSRGRGDAADATELQTRQAAARRSCEILGARTPRFGSLPDNRLDGLTLLEVIQVLTQLASGLVPDVIYTHHGGDLNVDHRIAHQAVMTLFRPIPQSRVRGIFAFEISSSTEWATPFAAQAFIPNRFVDIAATIERKIAALDAYATEMRAFPHARSREGLSALATWRGVSVGLAAAEAFMTLRWIERE